MLPAELQDVPQRQLAIRNLELVRPDTVATLGRDVSPGKRAPQLVNGLLRPALSLRSGATELWRLANVGPDAFYDVSLEGHKLAVIAEDGSPVWTRQIAHAAADPARQALRRARAGQHQTGHVPLLAHRYDGFAPQRRRPRWRR